MAFCVGCFYVSYRFIVRGFMDGFVMVLAGVPKISE